MLAERYNCGNQPRTSTIRPKKNLVMLAPFLIQQAEKANPNGRRHI
jgi:hypothetical protein